MDEDFAVRRDVQEIINHMNLMFSYVREHGTDVFRELAIKDPQKAIEQLPVYIDKLLGAGGNFFHGYMCGGPCELVTAPLLDSIGVMYACLERTWREKALRKCLNFLDMQNYVLAQDNVALINEPWLVGDIIINRPIYWCGFKEYESRQKNAVVWADWRAEFIDDEGKVNANSLAWLTISTFWKDSCTPEVREGFAREYPDIVTRTQDALAGKAYAVQVWSEYQECPMSREKINSFLAKFEPAFAAAVRKKIHNTGNFILLEDTIRDYVQQKEWRERDKCEKK